MAEPINLNRARKTRERLKKRGQADENAVTFGLTKAEESIMKARADKVRADLDAHKRDDT